MVSDYHKGSVWAFWIVQVDLTIADVKFDVLSEKVVANDISKLFPLVMVLHQDYSMNKSDSSQVDLYNHPVTLRPQFNVACLEARLISSTIA